MSTNKNEEIELDGDEKLSISKFLDEKCEKTVNLECILGIGGEGIVLAHKIDTRENHFRRGWDEKKGRDVALKFVEFKKNDKEDFMGPEKEDEGAWGVGINENGKRVDSQYFRRLRELGDYIAATSIYGGYSRPYIDFGISEIHKKYYYVIGKQIL